MSIIKEIYEKLQIDTKMTTSSREMELDIYEIARRLEGADEQEEEFLKDLFFEAGNCGRKDGFWSGFRLAVMLMAECFV